MPNLGAKIINVFYSAEESDLKMRVDYNDDLDASSKLQSGNISQFILIETDALNIWMFLIDEIGSIQVNF